MDDRIERSVEIGAPVARVWRALTDHAEFGTWFKVRLDGPFVPGGRSTGQMTYPGYEHMPWKATVTAMERERYFAFTWPHADAAGKVAADAPETLVEFRLEPTAGGTRLTVVESGFERLPPGFRDTALRQNAEGWSEQMQNIRAHVGRGG